MSIALFWFRQDLRLSDNPGWIEACRQHEIVIPIYLYDPNVSLLGGAQAWWLHHSLDALMQTLKKHQLPLILKKTDDPLNFFLKLHDKIAYEAIYWNRCYEPLPIQRDTKIKAALKSKGLQVHTYSASLFNEPWTVQTKEGGYFKVFTPYWRQAMKQLQAPTYPTIRSYPKSLQLDSERLEDWHLLPSHPNWAMGFAEHWTPGEQGAKKALEKFVSKGLERYKVERDFPASGACSALSPHLHFGEMSVWKIREAIESALAHRDASHASVECFLSELAWREFSYYLLYHFPDLPNKNFKSEFDRFKWLRDEKAWARWKKGLTGYPLVDAGMRQLWQTGYMHNRVRMVVASFLTKNLLIDWRKGAAWFLETLLDADLASNSASWQWVSGSGVDAAPYFRIFNPVRQSETFDPEGKYIRRWLPELAALDNKVIHTPWLSSVNSSAYPAPILALDKSRERALAQYRALKSSG